MTKQTDLTWVYEVLSQGLAISAREAEAMVGVLASALTMSVDGTWEQECLFDQAYDTLRLLRPHHSALAAAWARWLSAHLQGYAACKGKERRLRARTLEYALRALSLVGYGGSTELWSALETVVRDGDSALALQALVCAHTVGAVDRDRAANFIARVGRSHRASVPVRVEAWWRLARLRGVCGAVTQWRSTSNLGDML